MNRFFCASILTTLFCILFSTASFADDTALLILKSENYADTEATIAAIDAAGGHARHVIPPRAIIADIPPAGVEMYIRSLDNVAALYRSAASVITGIGQDISAGVSVWNYLISPEAATPLTMGRPLVNDRFSKIEQAGIQDITVAAAPGAYDTSSFMVGKIAVGIILPESNASGAGDENWSPTRQNNVLNEIVAGMNWWFSKGGIAAKLTFYYDQKFSIPTQYEPINMNCPDMQPGDTEEDTLVRDILGNMGYTSGDGSSRVRAYINSIRDALHTDWSFAFIVVDSLKDGDGRFPTNYFAYAYVRGPYSVMTYDNYNYEISNMDVVCRHEMGHIFGAADEYYSPGYATCEFDYYGYLNVYNGNCEYQNPSSVSCVMKNNSNSICVYTNGQLGWRDSDSDGKPDPVDNVVNNTLNTHTTPTREIYATFNGSANDVAYNSPSYYYSDVTINKIMAVKFRVDGGEWLDAAATDGAFDEYAEAYTFTTPALSQGSHLIETQALTGYGNTTVPNCNSSAIASRTIVVENPDPTPPVIGAVLDEGATASDETRLSAGWSATEPDSSITQYMYAIGTSPTDPGSGYIKNWTSTSTTPSVTATGLSLTVGQTYYFYVKAKNVSNVWSFVAASDGITIVNLTIGQAKLLEPGRWVALKEMIVTIDSFVSGYRQFYIEDADQTAGIRVKSSAIAIAKGNKVTVKGTINAASSTTNYEREIVPISAPTVHSTGNALPVPLGMNTGAVGGAALNGYTPGVNGGLGANNIGLLARIAGRVNSKGSGYFYVDDGYSRATDSTAKGIRIISSTSVSNGDYVVVTGIIACYVPSGWTEALPSIRATNVLTLP